MRIRKVNRAGDAYAVDYSCELRLQAIRQLKRVGVLVMYSVLLQATGCHRDTVDRPVIPPATSSDGERSQLEESGTCISISTQQGALSWQFEESGWDVDVSTGSDLSVAVMCTHPDGRMLFVVIYTTWLWRDSGWLQENADAVVVQTVRKPPYAWAVLRCQDGSIVIREDDARIGISPAGLTEDGLPNEWMRSVPRSVLDSFRWTRNGAVVTSPLRKWR
jgi:hypothetical protein